MFILPICTETIELRIHAERAARRAAKQVAAVVASPKQVPAPVAVASPAPVSDPSPKLHPVFRRNESAFLARMGSLLLCHNYIPLILCAAPAVSVPCVTASPGLLPPKLAPKLPAPACAVNWSTVRPLFALASSSDPPAPAPTWATARLGPALPGCVPSPFA